MSQIQKKVNVEWNETECRGNQKESGDEGRVKNNTWGKVEMNTPTMNRNS